MKIVLCGSMSAAHSILAIARSLMDMGHQVATPQNLEDYASGALTPSQDVQTKLETDAIRTYFRHISEGDAVLVVNEDKGATKNYIGGNSFLEIGFAYALHKQIYLLWPIPEVSYRSEIEVMKPVILSGDLARLSPN